MNWIRKSMALILVVAFLFSILDGFSTGVFAAEYPVVIGVDSYENGTLRFHWSQIEGAAAAVVTYHKPDAGDKAVAVTLDPVLGDNSAAISGLKADYIYDICVTVYGELDSDGKPTGEPIGRGLLFYMPYMTFRAEATAQPFDQIPGGGREIGGKPRIKLSWKVPKVYYDPDNTVYPDPDPDTGNNVFVEANSSDALKYMQNSLNRIYMDDREIATLNFRINISTILNQLNSGSAQAALLITWNSGEYRAAVSNVPGTYARVAGPDTNGFLSFELWGRADETSTVPEPPLGVDNVLPDNDILPGTVYYMNIKPIYQDSNGVNVAAVLVGNPADQNGSLLSGERSYICTPIRFQLTKDSANNIYVKIYRINQGSLDLPRLYYEVQASDDFTIPGDWSVKKRIDDTYFSDAFAVTVISGVNPNNDVYYKIVVKSESQADRLESLPLLYTLVVDESRPPLPMGVSVTGRAPHAGEVLFPDGGTTPVSIISTDITISWDKPLNWDEIKDDLYFHFLLSTNQANIDKELPIIVNGRQWGDNTYKVKYRLVKYISAASSKIKDMGTKLEFTLDAFDLFTGEDESGSKEDIPLDPEDAGYPKFLLPNTVYYLQMYTTKAEDKGTLEADKMSDKSIIVSFTTFDGFEPEVPLPMGFAIAANGKDTSVTSAYAYIELKFDKLSDLDWAKYAGSYNKLEYDYNIYYDIYMNSRTDTEYVLIGTTEDLAGDVAFTGVYDLQSTSVRARISGFTAQDAVNAFGYNLLPNTTYYFKMRTRLVIRKKADGSETVKTSAFTSVLPVTTVRLEVVPPEDSQRKPLAPTDFNIAADENGNPLVSGNSVTFTWKRQENDVVYRLVRTSRKVNPTDQISDFENDPEYSSFLQEYDILSDGITNGAIYLDPAPASGNPAHPGKFMYDRATNTCTYTVDLRMFPNKLYYFSLKAVRVNASRDLDETGPESVWVSIPVTTSLIDAPACLEVVLGAELGFYWTDATPGLTADDYSIYIKGPSDSEYKLMTRSQATVVKDGDGKTYYGRVNGLKVNTYYDIKVVKGVNTTVYEKSGMKTRDGYHEIEIRWIGKHLDNYSSYEIAVMEEGAAEYTILSPADLENYVDKNGRVLPYYTEETARTANSDELYYYAKIKSANVVLPGGITTKQPLRSNTKYYIKVRAVKIDAVESDFIAYSKYVGPINTRTEFNQGDYDNVDREEQEKAVFLDKMKDLDKGYYWRVAIGSNNATTILLKGERVANALANSPGDSFSVDMTQLSVNISTDEIYVPLSVIRAMNSANKSLVIRTAGVEMTLRPLTLNASDDESIRELLSRQEVKDVYVKLIFTRSSASSTPLPANQARVSDIIELDIQAFGLSKTDKEMAQMFYDRLYNEDTGLVSEKLNMLLNTYVGEGTGSAELIDRYTQNLIEMIEKDLSVYIDNTLKMARLGNAVREITTFGAPAAAILAYNSVNGIRVPYVLYDGSASWQKISSGAVQTGAGISFNLVKTGKFAVLAPHGGRIGGVPSGHWAKGYITSLASKYDLSDVFPDIGTSFMPDSKATCGEVALLYEKVIGKTAENTGLSVRQKNAKLGLDSIIHPNSLVKNIKRQETAAVLLKLFSVKKGVAMASLKPGSRIFIADEASIGDDYIQPVLVIVDMKVMELDDSGKFNPNGQMTRAEVVAAFVKMLKLTGEMGDAE